MKTSNIPLSLIDLWQWVIKPGGGCSDPLSPNVIHNSGREACLIMFMCYVCGVCVSVCEEEESTVAAVVAVIWKNKSAADTYERLAAVRGFSRNRVMLSARKYLIFYMLKCGSLVFRQNYGGVKNHIALLFWSGEIKGDTDGDGMNRKYMRVKIRSPVF